ncbi:MAG: CDP-alcohol phosphatidyltransferase family protein [Pseudomonadota bacterium]
MFDSRLRPLIDPPLDRLARWLATTGMPANALTFCGLLLGFGAAGAVVAGWFALALILIALNRLADGLDGPLARHYGATALGGYYDIVFDFLFYGAVPLAFALHDPAANALAAAVLLASFYANGATFLAFSALAAKTGRSTSVQGKKAIYYFAGIAEGAETIAVFLLFCLFPTAFPVIALIFAALCFVSAAARVVMVRATLTEAAKA